MVLCDRFDRRVEVCQEVGCGGATGGVLFTEPAWNGVVFYCKKSGTGFEQTRLERSSCLSVSRCGKPLLSTGTGI